jgi:predicted DNA-binding transcriptional regulator AlpA
MNALPVDLSRHRVLGTKEAASLLNYSVPHFRRLYRAGKVPAPIEIGERKKGWRVGALIDFVDSKSSKETK